MPLRAKAVRIKHHASAAEKGFEDDAATATTAKDKGTQSTAIFVDGAGTLVKLYRASSTPHMFVIDPSEKVVYAGAIDSIASTDKADNWQTYQGRRICTLWLRRSLLKPKPQASALSAGLFET